jgi:small subunit ribosomal protein S16
VNLEYSTLVATKIKLTRIGKMRNPFYRIVIADSRAKRDGRSIETIGRYNPKADPSIIEVDSDRAQYWLGVGAQPTEAVAALFRVTGDWQKFKGEPAPAPMLMAEPKADKHAAFAAAAAAAAGIAAEDKGGATTPKKKAAPKAKADGAPAAETPEAAAPVAEAPDEVATETVEVAAAEATEAVETDESAS